MIPAGCASDDGAATAVTTYPSTTTTVAPTTTTTTSTTTTTEPPFPSYSVAPIRIDNGTAIKINHVDTTDKVVFLTIDDGQVKDQRVMDFLVAHRWPATLFLVSGEFNEDPLYFAQIFAAGGNVSSHTLSHPQLKGVGYDEQRRQICGMKGLIEKTFGGAGHLFRPPYGSWDDTTLRAAGSCGINVVLTWNSELWEGNVDLAHRPALQPGDVFLTHFRNDLYDNLVALEARLAAEGFTVGNLEDYLPLG